MQVRPPSRRFDPALSPQLALPEELEAEIDRAHDVAERLYDAGIRLSILRPGGPRRVLIEVSDAERAGVWSLRPSELLELGAGRVER